MTNFALSSFLYMLNHTIRKTNNFEKHEFHDVLVGNQIFLKYFYVSWLMDYPNMIRVLQLNKSG